MVFLKSLVAKGLYSYDAPKKDQNRVEVNEADFSKSTVIVGPNDSGKSNLFRILDLAVRTLIAPIPLDDDSIFPSVTQPSVTLSFSISLEEAGVLVDFLSFYRENQGNPSSDRLWYFEFKNRKGVAELLRDIRCTTTWKLSNYRMDPVIELEFEKISLKLIRLQNMISLFLGTKIDSETGRRGSDASLRLKFLQILDEVAGKDEQTARSLVAEFFDNNSKVAITIDNLSGSFAHLLTEGEMRKFQSIYRFFGVEASQSQEIPFLQLLGSILIDKMLFTSGGRILGSYSTSSNDEVNANAYYSVFGRREKADLKLKPNGSNLAQFLFALKVSEDYKEIDKFRQIQERFTKILNGKVRFEVAEHVERKVTSTGVNTGVETAEEIRAPRIVIVNDELGRQFSVEHTGFGIAELLFLLSVSIGVDDSVLLLDEPSANLYPTLMKRLLKQLGDTSNQIITITHSPDMAHYQIFGRGADLVYVKKCGKSSTVKCLSNGVTLLGLNRSTLDSEIDSRIFFGKSIILCEGYADQLFLGDMAKQLDIDLDGIGSMIVSTQGMGNFTNYSLLMNYFGINYFILTDADRTPEIRLDLKADKRTGIKGTKFAVIGESMKGTPKVFFFKDHLEQFLSSVDSETFHTATEIASSEGRKDSKPRIVDEFLRRASKETKDALAGQVKPLFDAVAV